MVCFGHPAQLVPGSLVISLKANKSVTACGLTLRVQFYKGKSRSLLLKTMETSCHCHPLKELLRIFFHSAFTIADKSRESLPIPICDIFKRDSFDSEQNRASILTSNYIDNCVNLFNGWIVRQRDNKQTISVYISCETIRTAETLWYILKEGNPKLHLPNVSFNTNIKDFALFPASLPVKLVSEDPRQNVKIQLYSSTAFKNTVQWILNHFPRTYAPNNVCSKNIRLDVGLTETKLDGRNTPLYSYRKYLIAMFIAKAMGKSGFQVDVTKYYRIPHDENLENEIFLVFSGLNTSNTDPTVLRFNIGDVIVTQSSSGNMSPHITAEYLFNLRYDQVSAVSLFKTSLEQKSSVSWSNAVSNLTVSTINYDLLTKEPTVDCELIHNEKLQLQESGPLVVLYNYARVTSILAAFNKNVELGIYPALPPLIEVDFSENSVNELQLLQMLLHWPMVTENLIDFTREEINICPILNLIRELSQRFIRFYAAEVVLIKIDSLQQKIDSLQQKTPVDHHINKMMKRIYLLKAIRYVYEEFFDLAMIDFDSELILEI